MKAKPAIEPITALAAAHEISAFNDKLRQGLQRLASFSDEELAIATSPKDEIHAEDMVRLYRYRPTTDAQSGLSVLIVYALVGRYQMIDLESDRSFVRKLLDAGMTVYIVDWGIPERQHRWLTIDDYVSGYLDDCVDVIRSLEGKEKVNLLGVCQGGVFCTCYAALHPDKVSNLVLTVTPLDFHGDIAQPSPGSGFMNLWARALSPEDIDRLVDTQGSVSGASVGLSFLMMNPVGNATKYTLDLADMLDDDRKLLGFLRMERWIADRPDSPGEVVRQWFKDLYQGNKLIASDLELGGRKVELKAITMPVLNVAAEGDAIIPNACTLGHGSRFGTDDYSELTVPGGHIGTFVGGKAQRILGPSIVEWLKKRS